MARALQVEVGDKPTKIIDGTVAEDSVIIRSGAEPIDLGGSSVATGKGFKLAKETATAPMPLTSSIYGVAAAGKKSTVEVLAV
jgi:hypothetical protein